MRRNSVTFQFYGRRRRSIFRARSEPRKEEEEEGRRKWPPIFPPSLPGDRERERERNMRCAAAQRTTRIKKHHNLTLSGTKLVLHQIGPRKWTARAFSGVGGTYNFPSVAERRFFFSGSKKVLKWFN